MANIKATVNYQIVDGSEIIFRSPLEYSNITGLTVFYPNSEGSMDSKNFTFVDAHRSDVTHLSDLFSQNAIVKVILDCTEGHAYIQNADTNSYLEEKFSNITDYIENDITPELLGNGYGICDTDSSINEKIVNLPGYRLITNGHVSVKFNNTVLDNATMNINNKGAKPIYYKDTPISSAVISSGSLVTFVFDGSKYHVISMDNASSGGGGGGIKLYSSTGNNSDGAMTQSAVTNLIGDIGSILDSINRTEV